MPNAVDISIIESEILKFIDETHGQVEIDAAKKAVSKKLHCSTDIVESGIRKLIDRRDIKFGSHFEIIKSDHVAA